MNHNHKVDLRVFGAIGFQDLWLQKQGYNPKDLLSKILSNATEKGIHVLGLTSEDDKMVQDLPEDRFGFIQQHIPKDYIVEDSEKGVIRVHRNGGEQGNGKVIYLINAETRHASKGQDWNGLKLHIVGGNCIPKNLDFRNTVNYANNHGYMVFIMNITNEKSKELADTVIRDCTGVIGHDATNTFRKWMTKIPKIGHSLESHVREINQDLINYASQREVPWIAVSSAHDMSEIGRASFSFLERGHFKLDNLKHAIENRELTNHLGYSSAIGVVKTGALLRKYGGSPNRFKGMNSSYN